MESGVSETFVVPRGAAVCPHCHGPMIRRDVAPTNAPAVAGEVIRRRAYTCIECEIRITSTETSDGESQKSYAP